MLLQSAAVVERPHERSQNASRQRRMPVRKSALRPLCRAGERPCLPLPQVPARHRRAVRGARWRAEKRLRVDRGEPGVFASSNLAKRAYCRDCGTPLSFSYDLPEARFYVTIGSMDDPAAAPIVKQFGVESRIAWVKFCEDVPAERTGEDPKAAAFFAGMQSHQG